MRNYVIVRSFIKKGFHHTCNLDGNESFYARLLGWFLKPLHHTSDKKLKLQWERRNSCSKAFGITGCYNTWAFNPRPTSLYSYYAARRQIFKSCTACTIKITQKFWRLVTPLIAIRPCAAREPSCVIASVAFCHEMLEPTL